MKMKTFKFEIILSEEDVNGDEFYEECLEQLDGGLEMIRQAVEDALIYNNLIENTDPSDAVTFLEETTVFENIPENIKEILLAARQLALAANIVIDSNVSNLSYKIEELENKLELYNKAVFEYES